MASDEHKPCFFKILLGDFTEKLRIPPEFVRRNRREISAENAVLKGPIGKLCYVKMKSTSKGLFFQDGWNEFVSDNSLQTGEFLVFRYDGDLHFSVQVFGISGCERIYASVIKTDEEKETLDEEKETKETLDGEKETSNNAKENLLDDKDRGDDMQAKVEPPCGDSSGDGGKCFGGSSALNHVDGFTDNSVQPNANPTSLPNILAKDDEESDDCIIISDVEIMCPDVKWSGKRNIRNSLRSGSAKPKRQSMSNQNTSMASDAARSFSSSNPFFKVQMKPSSSRFAYIPANFARLHICASRKMKLRVKGGKSWKVFVNLRKVGSCAIQTGWKDFYLGNNLKLGDICIFELLPEKDEMIVHFFRDD